MNALNAVSIQTADDISEMMRKSETETVLLYKHSPICDLSALAMKEMKSLAKALPAQVSLYYVDVIADRSASQAIETGLRIRHESPQALLIRNGICHWSASHRAITVQAMKTQIGALTISS